MRVGNRTINVAVAVNDVLGESPIWHADRLCWIDIRRNLFHTFDPVTGLHRAKEFPEPVGAIVPCRTGGIVSLSRRGAEFHAMYPSEPQHLVALEPNSPEDQRANDATCDHHGRLWASTMADFARVTRGALYVITPDNSARCVRQGIAIPNALCCDPQLKRLYFVDSAVGLLEYLDLASFDDGKVVWTHLTQPNDILGQPDGAALDRLGHIWLACFGASCVVRIAPDGAIVDQIMLPVSQPTSVAFGGPNLMTLYITSAKQGLTADQCSAEPHAGALLSLDTDVAGFPTLGFSR